MNEYTMELIDRLALLIEENKEMRVKLDILKNELDAEQVSDAMYAVNNSPSLYYNPTMSVKTICRIMGWEPNEEAEALLQEAREKKEAENADG